MSLARFFPRVSDAVQPLLGESGELSAFLGKTAISLEAAEDIEEAPPHQDGFLLAVNLCSRLYPRIRIVAPSALADEAARVAMSINPGCEVDTRKGQSQATIAWGKHRESDNCVVVSARGWDVIIDQPAAESIEATNVLTALAAGALAVSELFRTVFLQFLPQGRTEPSPATLNVLNFETGQKEDPALPRDLPIGRVHLAGAGAVGQAAIYALARVPVTGTLVVVDSEQLTVSNLQRYVLSGDADVGISKCALAARALRDSSLRVVSVETLWGESEQTIAQVETVCTALDTAAARIAVQASLPRQIYNAWTQPADIGWSRHESFGDEPCLACLYLPTGSRPSLHELIARALKQHELRVLAYLTHRVPVDVPLRPEQIPQIPTYPLPEDAARWVETSILGDVSRELRLEESAKAQWAGVQVADMYRDGICAGAIVSRHVGQLSEEFAVPVAHQSALSGIMLATQLISAISPELREFRASFKEARLNVLAPLSQTVARPRQRTPGCLCSDSAFLSRYREKWPNE